MNRAEYREIQAAKYTATHRRSNTETARCIAHSNDWLFNEVDEVVDAGHQRIAFTIEDAAAAMVELGWIVNSHSNWREIPTDGPQAAAKLRALMDSEGKFPARWA